MIFWSLVGDAIELIEAQILFKLILYQEVCKAGKMYLFTYTQKLNSNKTQLIHDLTLQHGINPGIDTITRYGYLAPWTEDAFNLFWVTTEQNIQVFNEIGSITGESGQGGASTGTGSTPTIYINTNGLDGNTGENAITNASDGAKATVVGAVQAVAKNGVINIASGNYSTNDITITEDITIQGDNEYGVILNANSLGGLLTINEGVTVTLQNLTLKNGKARKYKGNIDNHGHLIMKNVQVAYHTGADDNPMGGAIFNDEGAVLELLNCDLFKNTSIGEGGCIYNKGKIIAKTTNFIDNLSETNGGAIVDYGGDINCNQCSFTNNNADLSGGSFLLLEGSNLVMTNCKVFNGIAYNKNADQTNKPIPLSPGGGFICSVGELGNEVTFKATNTIFIKSSAPYSVGGSFYLEYTDVDLNTCQFDGNQSGGDYKNGLGGAIYAYASKINVLNTPFLNNFCTSEGGAIYLDNGSNMIINGGYFYKNIAKANTDNSFGNGGAICLVWNPDTATEDMIMTYLALNKLDFDANSALGKQGAVNAVGGGALYQENGEIEINTVGFTNNVAWIGGAIRRNNGVISLVGVWYSKNVPDTYRYLDS